MYIKRRIVQQTFLFFSWYIFFYTELNQQTVIKEVIYGRTQTIIKYSDFNRFEKNISAFKFKQPVTICTVLQGYCTVDLFKSYKLLLHVLLRCAILGPSYCKCGVVGSIYCMSHQPSKHWVHVGKTPQTLLWHIFSLPQG